MILHSVCFLHLRAATAQSGMPPDAAIDPPPLHKYTHTHTHPTYHAPHAVSSAAGAHDFHVQCKGPCEQGCCFICAVPVNQSGSPALPCLKKPDLEQRGKEVGHLLSAHFSWMESESAWVAFVAGQRVAVADSGLKAPLICHCLITP